MNNAQYGFYRVWDPLLRGLHWWNAIFVFLQVLMGSAILFFGDGITDAARSAIVNIHAVAGYLLGAGLFARILWLFTGTPSASWRDLLPLTSGQRKVLAGTIRYYARLLKGTPPLYKAHNPLAGIVYALFFLIASLQVITGVILLNTPDEAREGSLLLEWHEMGYFVILLYIFAHLSAVVIHEFTERHSLIPSMLHGSKSFTEGEWNELSEETTSGSDEK